MYDNNNWFFWKYRTLAFTSYAICFLHLLVLCEANAAQPNLFGQTTVQQSKDNFKRGIIAFKAKRYIQAAKYLEQATLSSPNNPRLIYNLASTYYKLKLYKKSYKYYSHLKSHKSYSALSYYNLGLVSIKLERNALAKRWFIKCKSNTSNKKLIRLSNTALSRLNLAQQSENKRTKNWRAYLLTSGGHNDNVSLINSDLASTNKIKDTYWSFQANFSGYLIGNIKNGIYTSLGRSDRNYRSSKTYDSSSKKYGMGFDWKYKNLYSRIAADYETTDLGGETYQTVINGSIQVQALLKKGHWLKLFFRYGDYNSDNTTYSYLKGLKRTINITVRKRTSKSNFLVSYQLDENARNGLGDPVGTQYVDTSPTQHAFLLRIWLYDSNDWKISTNMVVSNAFYTEDNLVVNTNSIRRKDERFKIGFSIDYQIFEGWFINSSYQYSQNNSNISRYSYSKNLAQIGLAWRY